MIHYVLSSFFFVLIISCQSSDKSSSKEKAKKNISQTQNLVLLNPDTSLSGIKLGDAESADFVLDKEDKLDNNDQYHIYSKMYRETLTMTQHPGDGKGHISIFKVEYSDKADYGYKITSIDTFKTEKGIKLGMSKKDIVAKLGNNYESKDSTKGYIELYYRVEQPNDSQTNLLKRHNMPIYYASYKLWDNKLGKFEFGFEYP